MVVNISIASCDEIITEMAAKLEDMKVTIDTNDEDVDVDALLREADRLVQFALALHSLLSELQHIRSAVEREKEVVVSRTLVSFTCSLSDFLRLAVCSCCTNITFSRCIPSGKWLASTEHMAYRQASFLTSIWLPQLGHA